MSSGKIFEKETVIGLENLKLRDIRHNRKKAALRIQDDQTNHKHKKLHLPLPLP
jgi:hypothetical protein